MSLARPARIIFIGAPGAGKGTQTRRLTESFPSLLSISSGDLLRHHVRLGTSIGVFVESIIKTGQLVPDLTILQLIALKLIKSNVLTPSSLQFKRPKSPVENLSSSCLTMSQFQWLSKYYSPVNSPKASFLLDGFPRTARQAELLNMLTPVNMVAHIDTPRNIILERICNRWIHEPSGRSYNTKFNAPKIPYRDDITGEPLTRRFDDQPEIWESRLKRYEEENRPLLEYYDKLGILIVLKGNSSDEITPHLHSEFRARFCSS